MEQYNLNDYMDYGNTCILLRRSRSRKKGWMLWLNYVEVIRNAVGYEIPLSSDHFGHFDVNNSIRLGRVMEKYRLAWLEDMVPWFYTDQWKTVS